MNSIRDRVISLLGQGFSQSQVAAATGSTASWISQLLDEPDVREEVSRLRSNKLEALVEVDKDIDSLEKRALQLVSDKLPFVRSPIEAIKIFQTLNSAKRKMTLNTVDQDAVSVQSVNITLPRAAATITIQLNSDNQVVDVNGRSMATLPSRALPALSSRANSAGDVVDIPAIDDIKRIRDETTARLQNGDSERAKNILKNITTIINGVECVL